ncbi:MAG: MBL fold metallo-hydrolase [Myxococcales bacterium]|nr:MBL fold metallo-hydrolase [Myxococcales bacterium]MDH3843631.1 MBL fold metallo-hydrolase [Myxococcales bacterium]
MRVTILGSGSEGNALLLESDATSIVVDAGLSHRKLVARLATLGRGTPNVSSVLITHGHTDHAAHASVYATRWGCPVRATAVTLKSLRLRSAVESHPFIVGRRFRVGDITVHSCAVPHDAPQVALVFETAFTKIGLVTDLGHVPKGLSRFLRGCDTLLLESNHDPEMLRMGPYPAVVKRRVASALGHLSNEQASDLLADLSHAPACVVLMHLSKTNNSVRLARSSAEAALGHQQTQLLIARQHEPMELPYVGAQQLQLGL